MIRPYAGLPVRAVAALVIGGCIALSGCAPAGTVELTGSVDDDVVAVQAPSVPVPSPDLEAGFGGGAALGAGGAGASGGTPAARATTPTAARITGLGSFARVAEVKVQAGDVVVANQVIVVVDTELLDANVRAARAAQRTAQAQVPVVSAALDELASTRADIASTRSTVTDTIAQLLATRARLVEQLSTLQATLRRIEGLPPGGLPGIGVPPVLPPGVTPTSTPGGGGLPPGGLPDPAKLRAGIAQLEATITKIDAGVAKARTGLGKLSSASAKVSDARAQLRHVRTLARIAASASGVGVDLAKYQRSLAEVRTPIGGVVISVVSAGDVVAPGATLAEIRRVGRTNVSAWLAPADLAEVSVGDTAFVTSDSVEEPVRGTVTRIAGRADYPPTSSATREVHLTRAVPVEITVNAGEAALPPGTPVDISIVSGSK